MNIKQNPDGTYNAYFASRESPDVVKIVLAIENSKKEYSEESVRIIKDIEVNI